MREADLSARPAIAGRAIYRPDVSGPAEEAAPTAQRSDAERQLQSIVELAADAIVSTDASMRITLFNAAAERVFGYSRAEVLGQPLDLLIPETARGAHTAHVERFGDGLESSRALGERDQIWGRRRSGELFPAEASISRNEVGGAMYYTAILRDVTSARRAEAERESLLAAERAARATAESAERRMEFLARAGNLLHASLVTEDTLSALAGMIVPSLATFCIIDLVAEDGALKRLQVVHEQPELQPMADRLRGYPRRQSAYLTHHAIETGTGELVPAVTDALLVERAEDADHLAILRALAPASFVVAPLRCRDRTLGAILLARDARSPHFDAGDLALAEELGSRAASAIDNSRLYHQARVAIQTRESVLGTVSHDLRNPLSAIGMCLASLLDGGTEDAERTREILRTMDDSVRWSQRMIQDLLDVTSAEAGGLSIVRALHDPVLLVARAVHFFEEIAGQRQITLDLDLPDDLPPVSVDADRILQALGNLLSNAIKFTPSGGTVRVGARLVGDRVHCFVADGGPGVPPEDVPHVFDRFWTAQRSARVRGTGMGLAIVRGIAEAHAGAVWVEPAPEGGAMFVLALDALPRDTAGPPLQPAR